MNVRHPKHFLCGWLAACSLFATACETGTEPLDSRNIIGVHTLILVEGYSLPIDVWHSGELTVNADSTYTMIVNDLPYDHGKWKIADGKLIVTSRYEPEWAGLLQPHGILFLRYVYHYNNLLFDQGP
jgi:hypothetical protein